MAGRITLAALAHETGIDLDELLVTIWDSGLVQYSDASAVAGGELKQVLRAIGMPAYSDLRSSAYWCKRLGVEPAALAEVLVASGFKWRPGPRPIPVGAAWVLRGMTARTRQLAPRARPTESEPVEVKPTASAKRPPVVKRSEPVQALAWETIGAERASMRYLSTEEVLRIRQQIAREFAKGGDPFFETGVVNETLLDSAVNRPLTAQGRVDKYPSVEMAAAALLYGLVLNHPFHDGNKRTGLVSMLVFLDENGFLVTCSDDEIFRFVLQVAKHSLVKAKGPNAADVECLAIARWIHRNSRQIDHSERPLKWIKLKRILRGYGCSFSTPRVGNRLNISRSVDRRGPWGIGSKRVSLGTQVFWAGDGTEADRSTVATIRRELELDEAHNYDSRTFYDGDSCTVDDFIHLYRKTLKRLSRL